MKEVNIIPIFNQKDSDIVRDFGKIKSAAMMAEYSRATNASEVLRRMSRDINSRCSQFAFGAYAGSKMVGFIHGDAHGRCATIQSLYVLPKWQGQGLGHRLLTNAERAVSLFSSSIELVSLIGAMGFYCRHGYSARDSVNSYVKTELPKSRCETLPVFRCPKALADKIQRINPNFDAAYANVQHQPLFVYHNVDNRVVGYATSDEIFVQPWCGLSYEVKSSLRRRMEKHR